MDDLTAQEKPLKPLRFGILGAARIAPNALIKPARVVDGVEVPAVAARDITRARQFAHKHDVSLAFDSYEQLVNDRSIDAIYVALPNSHHADWSIRSLQAGKHVLCEKPLASNAEQARRIEEAALESGLLFAEAFHNLYHPLVLQMREIVRSGQLGEIQQVKGIFNTTIRRRQDIRFSYELAGGALMDLGCYLVSLTRFLFDTGTAAAAEPQVVEARARCMADYVDSEMRAQLSLECAEGKPIPIELECAMRRWHPPRVTYAISGTEGELRVINPILPQLWHRMTLRRNGETKVMNTPRVSTYECQLRAWMGALRTGAPLPTDAPQGVRNMELIDAIYRSAGLPLR